MKTIKTILILCVALCFASSCKKDIDMTLMQKTVLENADIRQIEVGDAWTVTVVADTLSFVELEYSAYLEPYLKAKMEGTQLAIGFTGIVYPAINSVFRATVHTTQLEKLEADDAATIRCVGEYSGQHLTIGLSDASKCSGLVFSGVDCEIKMEDASLLTSLRFVGSTCKADLEDASQFNGEIQVTDLLDIDLDDASRFVNKGGETANANIKLQDASMLNMIETPVGEMYVELSSGSEATIHVNNLLTGTVKEASTIYYKGLPQVDVNCSEDSQLIPF